MNVEVKHLKRIKGKGVFSKKSFSFGQVVFSERPLVHFRSIGLKVIFFSISFPH